MFLTTLLFPPRFIILSSVFFLFLARKLATREAWEEFAKSLIASLTINNPVVRKYCSRRRWEISFRKVDSKHSVFWRKMSNVQRIRRLLSFVNVSNAKRLLLYQRLSSINNLVKQSRFHLFYASFNLFFILFSTACFRANRYYFAFPLDVLRLVLFLKTQYNLRQKRNKRNSKESSSNGRFTV